MKLFLLLIYFFAVHGLFSQNIPIALDIDIRKTTIPISPYIYGTNGQSDDRDEHIAARRLGGARLTAYNWENNASHAGNNWKHYSDDYLSVAAGIDSLQRNVPGKVFTNFHDTSLANNCYSLL